jgi:hypothetical protein
MHILLMSDGKLIRQPPISQQRQESTSQLAAGLSNHSMFNYIRRIIMHHQHLQLRPDMLLAGGEKFYRVFVEVVSAAELFPADITGTSDPYVKVRWGKNDSLRSETQFCTLSPVWNQTLEIPSLSSAAPKVTIEVYGMSTPLFLSFSLPFGPSNQNNFPLTLFSLSLSLFSKTNCGQQHQRDNLVLVG